MGRARRSDAADAPGSRAVLGLGRCSAACPAPRRALASPPPAEKTWASAGLTGPARLELACRDQINRRPEGRSQRKTQDLVSAQRDLRMQVASRAKTPGNAARAVRFLYADDHGSRLAQAHLTAEARLNNARVVVQFEARDVLHRVHSCRPACCSSRPRRLGQATARRRVSDATGIHSSSLRHRPRRSGPS